MSVHPVAEHPLAALSQTRRARTMRASSSDRTGANLDFIRIDSTGARITLENRGPSALGAPLGAFWYHVEYEAYDAPLPDNVQRCYARVRPEGLRRLERGV